MQNGPTGAEWAELADWVEEGDYLGRREEQPPDGDEVAAHSMVIVGWLADDGSSVGPENFDASRSCNRLLVVDGNTGSFPLEGAEGLGSIVNASKRVVCRQALDSEGYSIDPSCDIDGNGVPNESGERCSVRLWDTLANGGTKSSFFIDMSME